MAWLPALSLAAFVIYMADHLGGWLSVRLSSFREDSGMADRENENRGRSVMFVL